MVPEDIADSAGRDVRELLGGGDYYRFNLRRKPAVGVRDAALRLEIEHVSYSPDYMFDAKRAADVDSEAVVGDDGHPFDKSKGLRIILQSLQDPSITEDVKIVVKSIEFIK